MRHNDELASELAAKAFRKLDLLLKEKWGHGAIRKLEQDLGYEDGWWKSHRRPKSFISLTNLLAVLRRLDEHPGEFFESLLAGEDWEPLEADVHARPLPTLAAQALELIAQNGTSDVPDLRQRRALAEAVPSEIHWPQFFAAADERRYDDPFGVLSQLSDSMSDMPVREIPMALAIGGSAYRMVYAVHDAIGCLKTAGSLSRSHSLQAEIKKRLAIAYLPIDTTKSLRSVRDARQEFAYLCQLGKIGETIVDEASCHYVIGDFEKAIDAFEKSLQYIDRLTDRYRLSLFQSLALCYFRLGQRREAIPWLEKADIELRHFETRSYFRAHYLWVKGLLLECSDSLQEAIDAFGLAHYFDACTCCIELCALLRQKNDLHAATTAARTGAAIAQAVSSPTLIRVFEDILAAAELDRNIDFTLQKQKLEKSRLRYFNARLSSVHKAVTS